MGQALDWGRHGASWPHREASSFVDAGGLRWHVQRMGSGPMALLIHGTGAATHTWRGLMPLLASHYRVVAADLPGHGYTSAPPPAGLSLPGMAGALRDLVRKIGGDVDLVVGHSAGAAIGARLVIDGALAPRRLVAINGAFLPLDGLPGLLFPPMAQLMAATPLAAALFAHRRWDRQATEKLVGGTGSALDAQGLALYGSLLRDPRHVASALGMMARWDLQPLSRDLRRLRIPLELIVGEADRAVPPAAAEKVRGWVAPVTRCAVSVVRGAGHLVHEERPADVAELILQGRAGHG